MRDLIFFQGKGKGGDGGVGGEDFYDDAGDGDDAGEGGFDDDGLFSRQGQRRRALLGGSSAQSALSGLIATRGQIFTGLTWIFSLESNKYVARLL